MERKAKKLVIITEKVIQAGVCDIIDSCGATGYTVTAAEGKGSRGIRSSDGFPSDIGANIKIEVIVSDTAKADEIAQRIVSNYFQNYSGITYALDVEILRPQKFLKNES